MSILSTDTAAADKRRHIFRLRSQSGISIYNCSGAREGRKTLPTTEISTVKRFTVLRVQKTNNPKTRVTNRNLKK